MIPVASLLTALFLSLSIAATPVKSRSNHITLPVAKRINANGGAINLVERDKARAAALMERATAIQDGELDRRNVNLPATDLVTSFVVAIQVGSPSTTYNVVLDTSSGNTWVGAGTLYVPSSTSYDTGEAVSTGDFYGEEWTDTIALGSLYVTDQGIGAASSVSGFAGVDGVLGLGPEALTLYSLVNEPSTEIPTVMQNLYGQGQIAEEVFGLSFAPTTDSSSVNGELTLGGADSTQYTGTLYYAPLATSSPASNSWGITQSISYGNTGTQILSETVGIIDSGTTLITIDGDAYSTYISVTGATYDGDTGLLTFTAAQYDALQSLNFHIGAGTFELTPNGQIWPRSLNSYIGGTSGTIYGIITGLVKNPTGTGIAFINGMTFLERFYTVYDATNSRFGIATTSNTDATTN